MSDELKPCPFCGSKAYVRDDRGEYIRVPHSLDAASYHAGLEAAAKFTEGLDDGRMNPEMARLVAHVAAFIRALPTPITLPEKPQC